MKDHSKDPDYCNYSFDDLYFAAYKKSLSASEKERLKKLPQKNINSLVKEWAQKAGWSTKEKRGVDNKIYTSFYPTYTS